MTHLPRLLPPRVGRCRACGSALTSSMMELRIATRRPDLITACTRCAGHVNVLLLGMHIADVVHEQERAHRAIMDDIWMP